MSIITTFPDGRFPVTTVHLFAQLNLTGENRKASFIYHRQSVAPSMRLKQQTHLDRYANTDELAGYVTTANLIPPI
jgi:hypothetical protein